MKILITVIVTVVVMIGALVGVGLIVSKMGFKPQSQTTAVRVETATKGPLIELVSVPGEVEPRTKVSISAKVSARIVELPHKEGDTVRAWEPATRPTTRPAMRLTTRPSAADPTTVPSLAAVPTTQQSGPPRESMLVRLDAKDLESGLESSLARASAQEAQIRALNVSLKNAELELDRQKQLITTKDVAQSAVDTAQTRVDELTAQIDGAWHNYIAAQADIDRAREALSYAVIASPINGVVTRVTSEVGEVVVPGIQGSLGSEIMQVADLSEMLMVARVDENSITQIKPGQPAKVRMQAYRDEIFEGTVESVALTRFEAGSSNRGGSGMMTSTKYFECKILLKLPAGRRMLSGVTADADIETKRHEGIRVPTQAVLARSVDSLPEDMRSRPEVDRTKSFVTVVYRCVNGKAMVTPVKVGASDYTHTLILSGLKEGEQVITGPFKVLDGLAHDQQVTVQASPGGPATSRATSPASSPATAPATAPAAAPAAAPTTSPTTGPA